MSAEAVSRLTKLLADIAATPGISPAHQYEVTYCRDQVRERLPAIEALVIAGVLHEAPYRLGLDRADQAPCRWWAHEPLHALSSDPSMLARLPARSRQATADDSGRHDPG